MPNLLIDRYEICMLVPPPDFINVVFTDKMPNLKMSLHICSLFVIELKMCVIKIKPPMFQYFCKICFISNVIFQVVYHTRCNKLHRSLTCRHARRKRYCNASAASLELGGGGKDLLKGTSTVAGKQTNILYSSDVALRATSDELLLPI